MTYQFIFFTLAAVGLTSAGRIAQRNAFLIFIFPIFLFVATREWTGCDFGSYLSRFVLYGFEASQATVIDILSKSEGGFILVNFIVIWLGMDYMWVNVICAIIFFFCLSQFALAREAPMAILALSFPIFIVQLGMSGIRQATAAAILLLAWNAFSDRRRIAMGVYIVLAASFHQTALMFSPLIFAVGRDVSIFRLLAGLAMCAPLAILFSGDRIDVYQDRYGGGEVESFGAFLRIALIAITATGFELYRSNFRALYPKDYALMRIFSLIGLGLVAIAFVSSIAGHRIGYYVMPVNLLTLIRLPRAMAKGRKDPLLQFMPFLAYGAYILVWFSISRHAQLCYIPYDSYLF